MDPVVDLHNIDRSGWHVLIGLIDDTHTIVSYLFLENRLVLFYFLAVLFISQKIFLKQKD